MSQNDLLEYIKDEMDFACELWQDLNSDKKTEAFRRYLYVQITSTIFAQQASKETIDSAKVYFESLCFDVPENLKKAI